MSQTTIDVKRPHSKQQEMLIVSPDNLAVFAGRRYGKTDAMVQRIFYHMMQKNGLYWWVGLSWQSASMKRAWREVSAIAKQILNGMGLKEREHINRSNHEIKIPGMGEIWFRTADNPSSLAGEGIRGAVVDEFSLMREIVWTEYLQATLLDYSGWVSFCGVPKGNNWAAKIWRGAKVWDGWQQVIATSYDNPFIKPEDIDAIKGKVPAHIFNQEYLAKIVSGEGMVFRNMTECANSEWLDAPIDGRQYIGSVDVADANDYTVVSVWDVADKAEVYKDRFRRVGYNVLEDRLFAAYNKFNLKNMVIEDNSIGQPVIDHLRQKKMIITPFHTSGATKSPIIQGLQSAFEHGEISILPDETTVDELSSYEAKKTASGYSYGAPSGMHDDTVMALAIGWQAIAQGKSEFVDGFEEW